LCLDQTTLLFIRERQIGHYVKDLSIHNDSDDCSRGSASLGLASRKDLEEFYQTLGNVDTLSAGIGDIGAGTRMPWMRTVKNLNLKVATFRISRVFDLRDEAPNVMSVMCTHYGQGNRSLAWTGGFFASQRIGLYKFHFDRRKVRHARTSTSISPQATSPPPHREETQLPHTRRTSEDPWRQLTHCSIQFEVGNPTFDAGPDLPDNISTPSLRSLRFVNVLPRHRQLIGAWIQSASTSLRYLEFSFYRAVRRDGEVTPYFSSPFESHLRLPFLLSSDCFSNFGS
jgi:hypothetical protein